MATLTEIRESLGTRLDEIAGLQVYAEIPGGSLATPCAVVGDPTSGTYNLTAGGFVTWIIPVRVYVAATDARSGQRALDKYAEATGANSVKAAVEDSAISVSANWHEPTLWVRSVGEFSPYRIGDKDLYGCEFTIEVVSP